MIVKIYSTPACHYCKIAKAFLTENNVPFEDIDVVKDEAAKLFIMEKTGRIAVPMICVDNICMLGYDESALKAALHLPER
jgi:alkyl hydroperoxide reductase subunit F